MLVWICFLFPIPHVSDIIFYLFSWRGIFMTYLDPLEIKNICLKNFHCYLLLPWSVDTMPSSSSFSHLLFCHLGPSSHLSGLCFFFFSDHMWTRKKIIKMICCFREYKHIIPVFTAKPVNKTFKIISLL